MFAFSRTRVVGLVAVGAIAFGTSSQAATLISGYTPGAGSQLLTSNAGSGSIIFNEGAALGGVDTSASTGASFDSVLFNGIGQWSIGDTVSITGVAMPLQDSGSSAGTFTFDIREGSGGGGAAGTTGLTSLGTATATYTPATGASLYYVNFDAPITFVADANSTSIVVNWTSTANFRYKKHPGPGGNRLSQVNYGNGNFVGGDDTVAVSIAGSVVPEPSSLALLGLGGLLIARRRRA